MKPNEWVTIGGGGGHRQVLKALLMIRGITRITAICPSTDSGGSTGILKKHYRAPGYLGDLTSCIAALCPDNRLAEKLSRRYKTGCLAGHSRKNLLFLLLRQILGDEGALREMQRICKLGDHNKVIPVSKRSAELHAFLKEGNLQIGETNIDLIARNPLWNPDFHSILNIHIRPQIYASGKALKAIKNAAKIVICPGDLFTSISPILLAEGMSDALQKTSATIVLVLNLVTKRGETDGYRGEDFVKRVEDIIGRTCDKVVFNDKRIPPRTLADYSVENKTPVTLWTPPEIAFERLIVAPVLSVDKKGQLCHDPKALAKVFRKI